MKVYIITESRHLNNGYSYNGLCGIYDNIDSAKEFAKKFLEMQPESELYEIDDEESTEIKIVDNSDLYFEDRRIKYGHYYNSQTKTMVFVDIIERSVNSNIFTHDIDACWFPIIQHRMCNMCNI